MNRAASQPPEARGLTRDGVRLLAATPDGLVHARFRDLPRFLAPGDLLVVNTSATLAAALPAQRAGGRAVTVHLSNQLDNGTWLVELRQGQAAPRRLSDGVPGEVITLPGGGSVTLLQPYPDPAATRIWDGRGDDGRRPGARLPGPARPADPLLLRPRPVAADRLPDGVRPLPRQRGDAERGPAVHRGPGHQADRGRAW